MRLVGFWDLVVDVWGFALGSENSPSEVTGDVAGVYGEFVILGIADCKELLRVCVMAV